MKVNFSKMVTRLCAAGLAMLGFGCSSEGPCMYGTPTGSWEIHGSVTDQAGAAVADAEIRVAINNADSFPFSIATADTNVEGDYAIDGHTPYKKIKVVCIPNNPALNADSTLVDLKYQKDKKDNDSWYVGHAKAKVDFRLKPKKEPE